MKTFKDKKGFTLVELLAVIVILAIVTVIATQTVLPYMSKAREQAFTSEANGVIQAASRAMSLISLGSITSEDLGKVEADYKVTEGTYCFSLKELINLGILEKDIKDIGATKYEGYVQVETQKNPSKAYVYKLKMHSDTLYVDNSDGGTVNEDMVEEYKKESQSGFDCSSLS